MPRLRSFAGSLRHTLRGKLIAIVAAGVLVPLVVLALWTTHRLRVSGEELLRRQIDGALAAMERTIGDSWQVHRGELMLLADNDAIRAGLRESRDELTPSVIRFLEGAFDVVRPSVDEVVFMNSARRPRWRIAPDPSAAPRLTSVSAQLQPPVSRLGAVAVELPITDDASGQLLGHMSALVRLNALMQTPQSSGPTGAVVTIEDRAGAALAHFGADRSSAAPSARSPAHGHVIVERRIESPPLRLVGEAPIEPYVQPFQREARRAAMLYAAIVVGALSLALLLVTRATRSLRNLVAGADAVAKGNLETRVAVTSRDEIGRLADAFNSMTHELNRTLRESEQRSALAAVGEFAAELAHEVRNPLTSIRLDLQRVHERLPGDNKLRDPLTRALSVVDRLSRTVTGALNVARSGSVTLKPVQLDAALAPALQVTETAFMNRDIVVNDQLGESRTAWLRADPDALTQLFTNILFNAAEAIDRNGHIDVVGAQSNGHVAVRIVDSGSGMSLETIRKIQMGFHTTKRGGTGIGLTIARRIAAAHGGQLTIDSALGAGTTVTITLPRMSAEVHA